MSKNFVFLIMFSPEKPYNCLPFLPPRNIDLEDSALLKACILAHKELAKLNMAGRLVPNQSVLISSIPLLESQASSAIENIVTTMDELFQYANQSTSHISSAVKETLRYRTALYNGVRYLKLKPLNIRTVCEICTTILGIEVDVRKIPGTTVVNDRTGKVIYTPPVGQKLLLDLLSNWQSYIHEMSDVDPLIKLAIQHYQFEAIHPFTDGNGRTGRILNLLFLIEKNLIDEPILYLSRYIIQHKEMYYQSLLNVTTQQAWKEWILFILEAVRETALWTTSKILAIQELIKKSCQFIQQHAPTIYSKELIDILFTQPYVRISTLVENHIAERQTASKYLKTLSEIGLLEEIKVSREKIFINSHFIKLLKENES